jgi:hypothetical protein
MTHSENFALNQWLSWHEDNLTYAEIIEIMKDPENSWSCDQLDVWEAVENFPLESVAEFIEDTKNAFEIAVKNMQKEGLNHE